MKRLLLFICVGISFISFGQTINDGLMMPKKTVCTGFLYSTDQWTNYWQGDHKRENGNIGTLTTRSMMWLANFGVTDKLNVIVMLPYVWTKASQGTLAGMEGLQDISLTAKYNFFKKEIAGARLKTFGALTYSTPTTNYSPDYYPLSLGSKTQNLSYRLTANYSFKTVFYVNASGAYTWRSNTKLDRPSYFTNGQIFLSNEVKMPNVFDFIVNVGYHKGPLQVDVNYMQQNTLGGGDIRKQDMPFVSNRMNYSKVGAFVMYYTPLKGLAVRGAGSLTVAGRNVGQSVMTTLGLLYTIQFAKPE